MRITETRYHSAEEPARQEIIDLYDAYTHTPLERRVFLQQLAALAGGTTAATALLPLLEANYARAAMVAANDARLRVAHITYPVVIGDMRAIWPGRGRRRQEAAGHHRHP